MRCPGCGVGVYHLPSEKFLWEHPVGVGRKHTRARCRDRSGVAALLDAVDAFFSNSDYERDPDAVEDAMRFAADAVRRKR